METTPVQEFLTELGDLAGFICQLLESPRKAQWHWPSFYLLYVEVDRMAGTLVRVNHLFAPPFEVEDEPPTSQERVADVNALFAMLDEQQKAIAAGIFQMCRATWPAAADPAAHARVKAHIHPKSGWYQTLLREVRPGELTADGARLQRTALPVARGTVGERIDEITASCMLRLQSFDLATHAARLAMARATEDVQERLGSVSAAMTACLLADCTLAELLHPCSR